MREYNNIVMKAAERAGQGRPKVKSSRSNIAGKVWEHFSYKTTLQLIFIRSWQAASVVSTDSTACILQVIYLFELFN